MAEGLLKQTMPAASGAETGAGSGQSSRAVLVPRQHLHLTLLDWSQPGQPIKSASKLTRRRPLLGLYDIAVIVLIIVSLAAAVTCLMRMA